MWAKHIHKCFRHIQLDEFVHEDHMAGAADGQPFGDSLDDADDDCFDKFRKIQVHIMFFLQNKMSFHYKCSF